MPDKIQLFKLCRNEDYKLFNEIKLTLLASAKAKPPPSNIIIPHGILCTAVSQFKMGV